MWTRFGFDFLAASILAITALLGACTPLYLVRQDKLKGGSGRSFTFIIGNMFSAGVMVSAGFCHLLGEAVRDMPYTHFPITPFLCGCGYLLTLCADKAATLLSGSATASESNSLEIAAAVDLAERGTPLHRAQRASATTTPISGDKEERIPLKHASISRSNSLNRTESSSLAIDTTASTHIHHDTIHSGGSSSMSNNNNTINNTDNTNSSNRMRAFDTETALPSPLHHHHHHNTMTTTTTNIDDPIISSATGVAGINGITIAGDVIEPRNTSNTSPYSTNSTLYRDGSGSGSILNNNNSNQRHHRQQPTHNHNHHHHHHHHHHMDSKARVSFITAVLMGVALCFHSLLEGAAMGAQETISNSLHIFIAIVSHKGLAAYALGSSIVESNVEMDRFWSVVLPFTFASPVGIFLGYIISDLARGAGAAALSALASGTFLYVAFMEVIPREMHEMKNLGAKLGALLLGFSLMSILAIWA